MREVGGWGGGGGGGGVSVCYLYVLGCPGLQSVLWRPDEALVHVHSNRLLQICTFHRSGLHKKAVVTPQILAREFRFKPLAFRYSHFSDALLP